jgi:hypothetical protein
MEVADQTEKKRIFENKALLKLGIILFSTSQLKAELVLAQMTLLLPFTITEIVQMELFH